MAPHEVNNTTVYPVSSGACHVWLADESAPRSSLCFGGRQGGVKRSGQPEKLHMVMDAIADALGAGPPTIHDISKAELEQVLTANAGAIGYVA